MYRLFIFMCLLLHLCILYMFISIFFYTLINGLNKNNEIKFKMQGTSKMMKGNNEKELKNKCWSNDLEHWSKKNQVVILYRNRRKRDTEVKLRLDHNKEWNRMQIWNTIGSRNKIEYVQFNVLRWEKVTNY